MVSTGRSAPSLLQDLLLFDPAQNTQPGYHLLEDSLKSFTRAPYIGQLLSPGSCTHNFSLQPRQCSLPLLDERPSLETVWHVAACCQKCRLHLVLKIDYRTRRLDAPCPTYESPLHHLIRSPERQDAAYRELSANSQSRDEAQNINREVHVYECSSPSCSAIVSITLTPPVLDYDHLHLLLDGELLRKRTDAAFESKQGNTEGMKRPTPVDVLMDLRAYIRNSWRQDTQAQISFDNKRFVVRFGPDGQPCAPVLMLLGFTLLVSNLCTCWYSYWLWYKNDCWTVPQPDLGESFPIASSHNVFLDNAEAELSALIIDRPAEERTASQDTTRLDSAYDYLSRALSCQNCMLSFIIVFALYWQSVDDKESSTRNIQKSLIQRRRYDSYSNHNSLTHINPQSLYRTWHSRWC